MPWQFTENVHFLYPQGNITVFGRLEEFDQLYTHYGLLNLKFSRCFYLGLKNDSELGYQVSRFLRASNFHYKKGWASTVLLGLE